MEGRCILTNAHVVDEYTTVRVRKHGHPMKYNARVLVSRVESSVAWCDMFCVSVVWCTVPRQRVSRVSQCPVSCPVSAGVPCQPVSRVMSRVSGCPVSCPVSAGVPCQRVSRVSGCPVSAGVPCQQVSRVSGCPMSAGVPCQRVSRVSGCPVSAGVPCHVPCQRVYCPLICSSCSALAMSATSLYLRCRRRSSGRWGWTGRVECVHRACTHITACVLCVCGCSTDVLPSL